MGLTLYEITDRELLWRMDEVSDNEGLTTSEELADALGLKSVDSRNVSCRLSWLKRYGAVDNRDTTREADDGSKYKVKAWYLTDDGERFVFTVMTAAKRKSVESIDDDVLLETVAIMTARYQAANQTAKNLLRRQWTAGTYRR